MPLIKYKSINLGAKKRAVIEQANKIIAEYTAKGFDLTLRQLYYQFVARGLIANKLREYKNLGEAINDGRLAGLIDWDAITDRTRNLRSVGHWDSPGDIINSAAHSFRLDKWADQSNRVEVWIEKDALVGVLESVCPGLDVPYFSCRGYTSQSELWSAAMRLNRYNRAWQQPVVIHLGDHDPSGIDMSRDIQDRFDMFGARVDFERIALNRDQVDEYSPPPNPAKITDSRANKYIAEHGTESWELDALDPTTLADLITTTVLKYREKDKWDDAVDRENEMRRDLANAAARWNDVTKFLNKKGK